MKSKAFLSTRRWKDTKFGSFINSHIVHYPTPGNLNNFWSFGFMAGISLGVQILTGVCLAMHYAGYSEVAFSLMEHLMRDVRDGYTLRYHHSNGSSIFFITVYAHLFRGLFYGSFLKPKQNVWYSGVVIIILMMATAFIGYVLPWGQMSYWGATVITNLFSAIPGVGGAIVEWLWGGFSIGNSTLNRFYSFHYILPFIVLGAVFIHLTALHEEGSTNMLGIVYIGQNIKFSPYFFVKDLFGLALYLMLLTFFTGYVPNLLSHSDNYIMANPMSTPAHIVPEWYFLPFYAILRSVPDKIGGVIAMFAAIAILMFLPTLNISKFRIAKFKPLYQFAYFLFVMCFLGLGYIGSQPAEAPYTGVGENLTIFYFLFFIVIIPVLGLIENRYVKLHPNSEPLFPTNTYDKYRN